MTSRTNFGDSSVQRPFPLPSTWKHRLRWWPPSQAIWTAYRSRQVHNEYDRRREQYARLALARNLVYREADVALAVRTRLAKRGYRPARRQVGDVHTFACLPLYSWHRHLLPDLLELGPVTHFDYTALGFSVEQIARGDRSGIRQRQEMVRLVLPALRAAHRRRPVDWVFFYGGGQDVSPAIVQQIGEELGIPTVNMSLDDKQGWAGRRNKECRSGAVDITGVFDLFMTSARIACEWHLVEGGRPIYLPEGFDCGAYRPQAVEKDIAVSFVGAAYGPRIPIVRHLRRYGVQVQTFGKGWPETGWADDIVEIFNRSHINLGIGGVQYSESLTNVKGRDFEIPGTGGGVYLTSFNPDLAQHFVVGQEILCYRNRDELLELIRYCLAHPEEAAEIARCGRERSLREHRWLHRYRTLLQVLDILPQE